MKLVENIINFIYYIEVELLRIKEKITGCYEYFKFIWQNDIYRDWDYEYLYNLIAFKLDRMSQIFGDSSTPSEHYQEIQEALKALEEFKDTIYNSYYYADVKERLHKRKEAWNKFHDILKEHAQEWWD